MSAATMLPLFEPAASDNCSVNPLHPGDGPIPRAVVQAAMTESVIGLIGAGKSSAVIEAATGVGKGKVSADLCCRLRDERGWRSMYVVDETDLANQIEAEVSKWGLHPAVEMSDRRAEATLLHRPDCVIASRQTIGRAGSGRGRFEALLNRLRWPRVDLLVIDEAHCGPKGDQIRQVREMVSPRFTLGLSATPYLADGTQLVPAFFAETAYRWPAEDFEDGRPGAISSGHLVPPVVWDCKTGVDLRGLKTTMTEHGRDYKAGDLGRVIGEKVSELVNAARMDLERYGPFNRALCFTPSVALAKAFAEVWTQVGYPAAAVWGDHPDKGGVLRRYREGEYRVLCVCQMGTKGFDDPPTDALILARPTKSYPLARQMLGRGLRLSPATAKTRCLVLGFAWGAGKAPPVSVLDIFTEGLPDADVRKAAESIRRRRRGPVDVNELVKEAREEVQRERAEAARRLRIAATRRDVRHDVRRRDIMRVSSLPAELERLPAYRPVEPVTREQRERAKAAGIGDRNIRGHSAASLEAMLRVWEGRAESGMASWKTANYLRSLDPSITVGRVLTMTAKEAARLIGQLKRGRA